jgi:hypothetical protein
MTHDELLAMIKPMTNDDAIFMKDALRAVVELCKEHQNDIDVSGFAESIMEAIQKELS